jgi:hypothetical protein
MAAWDKDLDPAPAAKAPSWAKDLDKQAAPAPQTDSPAPSLFARLFPDMTQAGKGPGDAIPGVDNTKALTNIGAGAVRGAGSIGATILYPVDKAEDVIRGDRGPRITGLITGQQPMSRNQERRAAMDAALTELVGSDPNSPAYQVGKVGAEIAGTAGVGGVLANGVRAGAALPVVTRSVPALARVAPNFARALESFGSQAAPAKFLNGVKQAESLADFATRVAGGATTGGASAALVDPNATDTGALIGGSVPVVGKAGAAIGQTASALVRPLFAKGQDTIAGQVLQKYAANVQQALQAARAAVQNVVPGSQPLTAAVAGDTGLAGLNRTMQNASPDFANELTNRLAQQNAARTSTLEGIAGNEGKLAIAREARDAATGTLRESVLDRAGQIETAPILAQIDGMLKNPNNAGKISQQALNEVRDRVAQFTAEDGTINSRALYALRKDINDVLGGKLQGEAGNLKNASGQLIGVKNLFDDAIDMASRRVNGMALPGQPALPGPGGTPGTPLPSWRDYLNTYSQHSKGIDQMEALQDVLKRAQTGTMDVGGNPVLSAAKLNQILKNEGADLGKTLTAQQMQTLRNVAADLNANTLALTAGKATGSNSVQNMSQDALLKTMLGEKLGSAPIATTTLGNLMKWPYARANSQIMDRINSGLLDPTEYARLVDAARASAQPVTVGGVPLSTLANPLLRGALRTALPLQANGRSSSER